MHNLKLAIGLVVLFGLAGCADVRGRDVGTLGGAGLGAALGSQVGGGNAGILGAAGGAVVGGLVGRSVGKSMEDD